MFQEFIARNTTIAQDGSTAITEIERQEIEKIAATTLADDVQVKV